MAKRRVLVVGYPKSGNTWLTRLTAELLGAPVKGFWREPQSFELAVEGSARSSEIEVYKGHQPYAVVRRDFSLANVSTSSATCATSRSRQLTTSPSARRPAGAGSAMWRAS